MAERTSWPEQLQPLSVELNRTVDRLRSRSLSRLSRAWDPSQQGGPTAAEAGLALAQQLADAAAALDASSTRELPEVEPHVVPDVLAVTGHDLLLALAALDTPEVPGESTPDAALQIAGAIAALRRFRSVL